VPSEITWIVEGHFHIVAFQIHCDLSRTD
jgi:hypothetical protein